MYDARLARSGVPLASSLTADEQSAEDLGDLLARHGRDIGNPWALGHTPLHWAEMSGSMMAGRSCLFETWVWDATGLRSCNERERSALNRTPTCVEGLTRLGCPDVPRHRAGAFGNALRSVLREPSEKFVSDSAASYHPTTTSRGRCKVWPHGPNLTPHGAPKGGEMSVCQLRAGQRDLPCETEFIRRMSRRVLSKA